MTFKLANAALTQAYVDVGLALPTAYEGVQFTPPDNDDWAALFVLPATNAPATLGVGGDDEEDGILQVDFNTPLGLGTAALLRYADEVQKTFIAGKGFTHLTQTVYVRNVDRSGIIQDDGWLRISISITWYTRYIREIF